MTQPPTRVTRGFSMDDGESSKQPRRVRTRQQIMNGEGKRPPAAVPLRLLAHNPFNPREELTNLDETAASLQAKGQIQPVTVSRRAAFLEAHPGQEAALGDAEYVVIDGNRRLAAAGLAGLAELRIDVNDDLAASAADLLEAALIANVHRVDVPPLDQARAIQELVKVHGSQAEVARKLGMTPAWVSQRLALLELTPELKEKVESGELPVKPARRIGRLPKEKQAQEAEKVLNAVKPPRQRASAPTVDAPSTVNPVNASGTPSNADPSGAESINPVNAPSDSGTVPTPGLPESEQPRKLPYDDPGYVVRHLFVKMTPDDFTAGAVQWLRVLRNDRPEAFQTVLRELGLQEAVEDSV